MKKTQVCILALACVALVVLPLWAGKDKRPSGGPSYTIQKLDDWGGYFDDTLARDINGRRASVGQVNDPVLGTLAAYWSPGGELELLPGGLAASEISELGEIIGGGLDNTGKIVGRYWKSHADQAPLTLRSLPGDEESAAYAINGNGVICGYSRRWIYGPDPRVAQDPPIIVLKIESRAVVWRIVGGAVEGPFELPNLLDIDSTTDPANVFSTATDINDNDAAGVATVVGAFMSSYEITADKPDAQSLSLTHAVEWTISFDIEGNLMAVPSILSADAQALAVNNSDEICGRAWAAGQATEAVVWDPAGSRTLDRSKFVFWAQANGINDEGVVVGTGEYWKNFDQGLRAVVWSSSNSSMIILEQFLARNSPFAHLSHANAVNQSGEIVGSGWDGASTKAFLAIPD